MAEKKKQKDANLQQTGGKHLAPENPVNTRERTGKQTRREDREKKTAQSYARRRTVASGKRPARLGQTLRAASEQPQVNARALYKHFLPYIKSAHERNERSLKAGVWLLVALPVVLVIIQELTDASRIAFLIIWIFGMFGIATALIFTAYADHDLKKTLEELEAIVPPDEEIEIGNLLPVDAEGEGWLINPEDLPIPLPDLAERIPQRREELKSRRADRRMILDEQFPVRAGGKHLKKEKQEK